MSKQRIIFCRKNCNSRAIAVPRPHRIEILTSTLCKCGSISCRTCCCTGCRIPPCKRIGILYCGALNRGRMRRYCSMIYDSLFNKASIIHQPSNRILVQFPGRRISTSTGAARRDCHRHGGFAQAGASPAHKGIAGLCRLNQRDGVTLNRIGCRIGSIHGTAIQIIADRILLCRPGRSIASVSGAARRDRYCFGGFAQASTSPARKGITGLCRVNQRDGIALNRIGCRIGPIHCTASQIITDRILLCRPGRSVATVSGAARRDCYGCRCPAQACTGPAREGIACLCRITQSNGVALNRVRRRIISGCCTACQVITDRIVYCLPLSIQR